jgi:gliding motility-associated-like protein
MKIVLFVLILSLFHFAAYSQSQDKVFNGCATDLLHQSNPFLLGKQQQLDNEKYLQGQLKKNGGKHETPKSLQTIPVVVHIIHNSGPENINDAQVLNAIANINAKFAASPFNQIQFCMAQRDPNGNATTGITRNTSPLTNETMEVDDIALKNINRWPPTCYLNIWVIKEISSLSMGTGVIGYAFLPSAHGQPMDGVVIEAGFFGNSSQTDAVGTHEIGHYLGLYHTFEGGCNNANCLLNGDQVCDTPPDQTTFAACNPSANSCNTDADDPSANNPFTTDVADLSDDYMDYSAFSCYNQFTEGQYDRMYYFLTQVRGSLLNCLSCTPPCSTPITATITNPIATTTISAGSSISFSATTNSTSPYWYINPGTPLGTGTSLNYTFTTPGTYWMKFRVPSTNPSFCLDGLDSVKIMVNNPLVSACDTVFAGNDSLICTIIPVQLNATPGFDIYSWTPTIGLNNPNSANPVATVSTTTEYVVAAGVLGQEMITNGDFSNGNTGFSTGMIYSTTYSPCNYYVDPLFFGQTFPGLDDHTLTTDGMFMAMDGCVNGPTIIYEQTVLGLNPSTSYHFSFWATRAGGNQPIFEIHLIGNVTGDFLLPIETGISAPVNSTVIWDEYGITNWNSGVNSSVTIRIVNLETNGYGVDFGLDDVSLRQMCTSTDTVKITVINGTSPHLDLGNDTSICVSGIHVFDAGPGFTNYTWNDGSTDRNFTAYGIGTYWVTVTDSCGNIQSDTVHITPAPLPQVDLGSEIITCSFASVPLTYTSGETFTSFSWSPAANLSCTTCPNPIAQIDTQDITFHLYASTSNGCTAEDSIAIKADPGIPLDVDITTSAPLCLSPGSIVIQNKPGTNGVLLIDFNQQGYSTETSYSDLTNGSYALSIRNIQTGCSLDTMITFEADLENLLYIPNSFTPNGDQVNNLWKIEGVCIAEMDCRIYNRWGEEVGLLKSTNDTWDGKYNGLLVPDGIYTYTIIVTYSNEKIEFKSGFIAVIH